MKISFCTVCMGRLHHLAQVYERNIRNALSFKAMEFILLNYNSPDSLENWVNSTLTKWLDLGVVKYYKTRDPIAFHGAHAKNLAHRLASGNILVNLDADNFFQDGFAEEIASHFERGARGIATFGTFQRGRSGRIALLRDDFIRLGGYDEDLTGWGYEDKDLIARARKLGLPLLAVRTEHALAIQHDDNERVRFCVEKDKRTSDARNRLVSVQKIKRGEYVANAGREWGRAVLESVQQ